MDIVLRISFAVAAVSALLSLTGSLHMLQQNSYYNSRYRDWLKHQPPFRVLPRLNWIIKAFLLLTAGLVWPPVSLAYMVLSCLLTFRKVRSVQKRAIKPLVFTARVKRMYLTAGILLAALTLLNGFVPGLSLLCTVLLLIASVSPLTAITVNLLNHPMEKAIGRHFIRDAQKNLRERKNLIVVGITGSYGKTSTKYILERILSEKYNVCMTPGSFNTTMGVVRTIREQMRPDCQLFLCEMGAKNIGDIQEICDIVHPNYGVITSVGPQHLQTFGTVENVCKTKFELADAVKENGGTVFLNGDNEWIAQKAGEYPAVSYGLSDGHAVTAKEITCGRNGSSFTICFADRELRVSTKLLGRHNILNILAAAAVAQELGVTDSDLRYAVAQLAPVEHRLQMKPFLSGAVLIDDAYNANPEGSLEAVSVLASFTGMKKIIVTPGIVELGEKEYEYNHRLGLHMTECCDRIYVVGEKRSVPFADAVRESGYDPARFTVVKTFRDAMAALRTVCDADTVVLFENDLPDNYAG